MRPIKPHVEQKFNPRLVDIVVAGVDNADMPTTSDHHPGETIKRRLKELGKTSRWLSEEVDVSENAVSKWKKTGQISKDNLKAVSGALKISIDELLYGQPGEMMPSQKRADIQDAKPKMALLYLTDEEVQIITHFRESTPLGQDLIKVAATGAPKMASHKISHSET